MIEDLRLFGSCAGPKVGGPLHQTWIVDVLALKDLGPVKPILGSQDILKIIHHADFEREVFSERGIAIQNVFDTCEASRAMRSTETGHGLADCVLRELGLRMDKTLGGLETQALASGTDRLRRS